MLLLLFPRGLLTSFVASLVVFTFLLFGVPVSLSIHGIAFVYRSMPVYIICSFSSFA